MSYNDEYFSEEVLQKAKTAKAYIEHLYKVQSERVQERRDRCVREGWTCCAGVWAPRGVCAILVCTGR